MAGAESLVELKDSAMLGKTFPVGWVAWWLGQKAGKTVETQHSWGMGFAELGNISSESNSNLKLKPLVRTTTKK